MSGIRVGSRLDQLLDLERQVKVQIELARREVVAPRPSVGVEPVATTTAGVVPAAPPRAAVDPGPGTVPAVPASPTQEPPASCLVRVPLSMLEHRAIRDWARSRGFDPRPRGPLDRGSLLAFVEAHS